MEGTASKRAANSLDGTATVAQEGLWQAIEGLEIDFVTGVPDSDFKGLIADLETTQLGERYVLATREDNAIAMAVGARLAGRKPLMFMESSGVGNAIDALTSLAMVYEVPMVILISWAGYEGRDIPHHNVIGEPLRPLFETLGAPISEVRLGDPPAAVAEAIKVALEESTDRSLPAIVLGIPEKLEKGDGDD